MNDSLAKYPLNQSGYILAIDKVISFEDYFEFGIYPGAQFEILHKAPFNGPISLKIDENILAIRKKEALLIKVTEKI